MKARLVDLGRVGIVTAFLVLLLAGGAWLAGRGAPRSILLGGAFMLVNFHLIRWLVSRLVRPGKHKGTTLLLLGSRFALWLLLLAGVFWRFPVGPMSFAAGATMLVVALVLDATCLGAEIGPGE